MSLGEKIKAAREQCGKTQKQLAMEIGAKHNSISNWEKDLNRPDVAYIPLLAQALQVEPGYFFSQQQGHAYTLQEMALISRYRKLDVHGRQVVDCILQLECERLQRQQDEAEWKQYVGQPYAARSGGIRLADKETAKELASLAQYARQQDEK